jgi:hypothetical protein
MPLIHSKKPSAFKENIRTEVHAGKPVKQAVAIAYSEQRRAQHHKAHGGPIESCSMCNSGETAANEKEPMKLDDGGTIADPDKLASAQDSMRKAFGYAEGGQVNPDDELHDMVGSETMDAIHSKDYKKLMSGIEAMVLRCLNKKEEI